MPTLRPPFGTSPYGVLSKTGSYTVQEDDPPVIVFTLSGAATCTLNSALPVGCLVTVSNAKASGANSLTVAASSGTCAVTSLANSVAQTYVFDGTNWEAAS